MSKDNRDLLPVLQAELRFVEGGGYARQAWRPPFFFQDSLSCPNYRQIQRSIACKDCVIGSLAPNEKISDPAACQHIIMTSNGESIAELYRTMPLPELEARFAGWLTAKIRDLEHCAELVGERC